MTIHELIDKHYFVGSVFTREAHAKISVEFAISVLEEIVSDGGDLDTVDLTWNKLQKLKQYLDEKV